MLGNSNTVLKKITISLLVIALTSSNFLLVGSSMYKGLVSYALDDNGIIVENETNNEIVVENETDNEVICEVNVESSDLHKTRMEEENTEFTEKLNLHLKNVSNILVEDVENTFYDNEEQITENANLKYVKTILNKENLSNILGETGKLKVLDKEGNILAEISLEYIEGLTLDEKTPQVFTNITDTEIIVENEEVATEEVEENLGNNTETENNEIQIETRSYVTVSEETVEIEYEKEIKEVKFNIENINGENEEGIKEINFVIENTKSIFAVTDLDSLNYLKENKKYTFNKEENEEEVTEIEDESILGEEEIVEEEPAIENIIAFKDTITKARLESNDTEWVLGETNEASYRIVLNTTDEKTELYKNPTFVIELPASVEYVDSANSRFTVENDGGVFTEKHVSVVTLAGVKYVVITLEGEQTEESIANGDTIINLTLKIDVAEGEETSQTTRLYYQNETVTAYENGTGFDTDTVDIALVLASEETEEIVEQEEVVETETPEETPTEEPENDEAPDEENIREVEMQDERIQISLEPALRTYGSVEVVKPGDEYRYQVLINNYLEDISNATLTISIPEGVTLQENGITQSIYDENEQRLKDVDIDYTQDLQNNRVLIELPDMPKDGKLLFFVTLNTDLLEENSYCRTINNEVTLKLEDGRKYKSDVLSFNVSDVFLDIETIANDNAINVDDTVTFEVKITNKGLMDAVNINYDINIPKDIKGLESEYIITSNEDGSEYERGSQSIIGNNCDGRFIIFPQQHTCVLKMQAIYKEAVQEDKEIEIVGKINEDTDVKWRVNLLKAENPAENDKEEKPQSGEVAQQAGDTSGQTNTNQSDVENNEKPNTTDTDKPNNSNNNKQEVKDKFDLSLTQSLKKITVTNSQGTTTYNYNNTSFAKIEIPSKYMNGSTVAFEYEIIVKNEGTIEGYARKIADYMPKGLKFNSELNPDWYVGDDGNIYSVALIDKLLKPGETATLKLVLTKQMTNTNTGTVTNIAEIYEVSNSLNAEDINSIPGDKLDRQNDMAKVEVIVAVKTGTIIMYIMLTIIVLAILGLGIYKVKNITIKKEGK